MNVDRMKRRVITELNENCVAAERLATPPFEFGEVLDVITEAIELIEAISPPEMSGRDKRAVVAGVIEWLDNKFNITATVVKSLVPKWLRWLPIRRIVKAIFPAMIDIIVRLLNKYVWKVDTDTEEG